MKYFVYNNMALLWIKSSMAWGGTGLKSGPKAPFLPLQNVQNCPNSASKEVFLKIRSIIFDPLLGILDPHNSPCSVSSLPPAFVLVSSLCSQHQGQRAHGEVWLPCPGFYHFLLPWPTFDDPLFCGELEWQDKELLLLSRGLYLNDYPSGAKSNHVYSQWGNMETLEASSVKKTELTGGFYKLTDNQLVLCLVHLSFGYFIENISN